MENKNIEELLDEALKYHPMEPIVESTYKYMTPFEKGILLEKYSGKTHKDIAKELGISISRVGQLVLATELKMIRGYVREHKEWVKSADYFGNISPTGFDPLAIYLDKISNQEEFKGIMEQLLATSMVNGYFDDLNYKTLKDLRKHRNGK
jgi:hypothetical protein